jgi:hypothetical protein
MARGEFLTAEIERTMQKNEEISKLATDSFANNAKL